MCVHVSYNEIIPFVIDGMQRDVIRYERMRVGVRERSGEFQLSMIELLGIDRCRSR